jgi:8-oxo-dGTP diphosphatase/2-hydroxy-dATP diphosphatase
MKIFTLVLVSKKCGILLGLKKRGFGEGKWNGFGGKIESGESVIQAAIR